MAATPFPSELFHGGYPCANEVAKTANYTITKLENGTLFTNTGAEAAVVFTLPALSPFLYFRFMVTADQSVTVSSAAGDDMVVFNDATADSVAFSTSSEKIGGSLLIFSNSAGTKWYVNQVSAGSAHTLTVAT